MPNEEDNDLSSAIKADCYKHGKGVTFTSPNLNGLCFCVQCVAEQLSGMRDSVPPLETKPLLSQVVDTPLENMSPVDAAEE